MAEETKIALFFDFDNLALGIREAKYSSFDLRCILQRLVEKGRIVVKRAYADWEHFTKEKRPLHEGGVELIYVPRREYSGKNSADIRMVVDAMDLCFSKEHIDMFVLASGDSDFTPLVAKLKENAKTVIGLGVRNSTSKLLIDNCDEFIFYDDLVKQTHARPRQRLSAKVPKTKADVFQLVLDAIEGLVREDKGVIWASVVKQTIKRKNPDFNESAHGYNSFSQLMSDMRQHGLIQLEKDERSGGFVVTAYQEE
jgi:uncharacterized protein (TIGR00288 family)